MTMKKVSALVLTLVLVAAVMTVSAAASQADKDNTEATVTFTTGLGPGESGLTLKKAPQFDFGRHTISPHDETYAAISTGHVLHVEDARYTGAGWNVVAEITDPFTGQATGGLLTGSRITIESGTITYGGNVQTPPAAPNQPGNITLNNSGGPVTVFTAGTEQGKGIWFDNMDDINLHVPGSVARAEAYHATILWTLSDVPV